MRVIKIHVIMNVHRANGSYIFNRTQKRRTYNGANEHASDECNGSIFEWM